MLISVYGLYPDPDSAQRAVEALRGVGVAEQNTVIISSEPFESYEFGRCDHRSRMPWLAALGGLIGGISGYWLASLAQKAYPLPTGAMPIVTQWTNGIITYELTMLGAILTTLATLLFTAKLPRWKGELYDPAVSEGRILVGVVDTIKPSDPEIEALLRGAGATEIKKFMVR